METRASAWTIRTAKSALDCDRCRGFITRGMEHYVREFHGKRGIFCLPCGDKLSDGQKDILEEKPRATRSKRARRPHDPLLSPGYIVHGLGRMGA